MLFFINKDILIGELVFFSPPSVEIRGFNDSDLKSLLNCSQCLPTCHESVYDTDTSFSHDTLPLAQESYGVLDIFYRNEGAVKYQRDVTFGWVDLLGKLTNPHSNGSVKSTDKNLKICSTFSTVSFGGIAGLFLGFSLLSIVEFVYWSIKLALHQLSNYIKLHSLMLRRFFLPFKK